MGERVIEAADRVQDEQPGTRAVADDVGARGDALVRPRALRAVAADDARDVRAVATADVGVGHALGVGHREQVGERVQVGLREHVLDDVVRVLDVRVRPVDARVVDQHADAAAGEGHPERVPEAGVRPQAVDAGEGRRAVVLVLERVVVPDGAHARQADDLVDLGRGGDDARDGQVVHQHAAQPEAAQRGALLDRQRALALERHDDLQEVGGGGDRERVLERPPELLRVGGGRQRDDGQGEKQGAAQTAGAGVERVHRGERVGGERE